MAIERTYYCDGPGCGDEHDGGQPCNVRTATPPPYVPVSFIATRESLPGNEEIEHHFCGWGCLMKYAAAQPIPERIEWDDITGGDST